MFSFGFRNQGVIMATAKFRFDFEKLETYQQAFRLNREIFKISLKFPRLLQSSLGDQLRRASLSILTNLAEAAVRIPICRKNGITNMPTTLRVSASRFLLLPVHWKSFRQNYTKSFAKILSASLKCLLNSPKVWTRMVKLKSKNKSPRPQTVLHQTLHLTP